MTPRDALTIMVVIMVICLVAPRLFSGSRTVSTFSTWLPVVAAFVLSISVGFWWGVALSLVAVIVVVLLSVRGRQSGDAKAN